MEVGTRVQCRWRDAQLYPVRVIERRCGGNGPAPEEYEYYVHYEQFNRRLDTWVTIAEMDIGSAEQVGPGGYCLPRHRAPCESRDDGSKGVGWRGRQWSWRMLLATS
jgi:hypothetical protein